MTWPPRPTASSSSAEDFDAPDAEAAEGGWSARLDLDRLEDLAQKMPGS